MSSKGGSKGKRTRRTIRMMARRATRRRTRRRTKVLMRNRRVVGLCLWPAGLGVRPKVPPCCVQAVEDDFLCSGGGDICPVLTIPPWGVWAVRKG